MDENKPKSQPEIPVNPGVAEQLEQIKKAVPDTSQRLFDFMAKNAKPIAIGCGLIILTAALYSGVDYWRKRQIAKAADAMGVVLIDQADPALRAKALEELLAQRVAARDAMFDETSAATSTMDKLSTFLSTCVNCYNCRMACPVCYCKECVFLTDVFDHKPWQYLSWARQRGALKMPTDTTFFHLTRLAHMSTACVGCGQCSNACPNGVPVMELFRTIAASTQLAFEYEAGRNPNEAPPLSVFREREFPELTGGLD